MKERKGKMEDKKRKILNRIGEEKLIKKERKK